jgi:tRNA threonylcarbamoyladenosine biosynthesis protein TsaE
LEKETHYFLGIFVKTFYMMLFEIENLSALPQVVSNFLKQAGNSKHFAIFGPMGIGKTTFIKEVCKQLQVNEVVTSPTFALVNEYSRPDGSKVYHFDFYRIKKEEELYDMGYEDYVYSDAYCFIEWPEKALNLIPPHFKNIRIEENHSGKRQMEVNLD